MMDIIPQDPRIAHTAEHIFMHALYELKPEIRVVKVEHFKDINYAYVETSSLEWSEVLEAAKIANRVISEDRRVYIEYFKDLNDAKAKYPDLRAYEERIKPPVRVVVIEGYDYAACTREHTDRTGRCILFLPLGIRSGKRGRYIIEFLAGFGAVIEALNNVTLLNTIATKLSSHKTTLLNTLNNLVERYRNVIHKYRGLQKEFLDSISEYSISGYKIKLIYCINCDKDDICEYADKYVKNGNRLFIAFTRYKDRDIVVLVSSKNLLNIHKKIVDTLVKLHNARGGGREGWFIGSVSNGLEAYKYLSRKLNTILST